LCEDDRIVEVDLEDQRARLLHQPTPGEDMPARGYTAMAAAQAGMLYFADGSARIWSLERHGVTPELVFANGSESFMPLGYGEHYPFAFDEVRLERVGAMDWVERYGALLVQDQHGVDPQQKRLLREMTERVHLRLLDLKRREVLPWTKAIAHGDANTMWNAKAERYISYFHQGSMAVAQDDASTVWLEHERTRLFRIADGLLGSALQGNLNLEQARIELRNPLSSESSAGLARRYQAPTRLETRHEPRPMRGAMQALMVNSSAAVVSDRIGNYSLARRLELELGAELASRHRVRLDLVQRSALSPSFVDEVDMVKRALAEGWTPKLIFFELKEWGPSYFDGTESGARRDELFGQLRALAEGRSLVFFDNSALGEEGRDGLRVRSAGMEELVSALEQSDFIVISPSDLLFRELMRESPWGNQTFAPGHRHGATWAIDATARLLAMLTYPRLRAVLEEGRAP
jgi:hypothetical protein